MDRENTKPLAYSYVRMSTDMQLKGNSLERQKEKSKEYAIRHDLQLVENFEDIGVSAFKGKNIKEGMLGDFISLIENKTVPAGSYLLIESLDRLSRENIFESIPLFIKILKSGIKIVTLIDEQVYGAENADFKDLLYPMVVLSRAHEESVAKSFRVGKAWANKRKNIHQRKLTKVCPAWLKLNTDSNSFEVIPGRDDIVKRIFDLADSGYGSYSIGRILNNEAVPPFGEDSKGWHASYISRILNNRSVLGEFQPHKLVNGTAQPDGDTVPDYFPQLIDEEQFLRIKHARRKRQVEGAGRKGPVYRNLFSRIAKCAYCASPMRFVDKGPPPKGGQFLRCTNADRHFGCSASNWRYDHFENVFLYFVHELDLVETLKRADEQSDRYTLEQKLVSLNENIRGKRELLNTTFDMLQTSNASKDFIQSKIEEISSEILELENQKGAVEAKLEKDAALAPVDDQQIKSLIKELQDADDRDLERKRRVVANRLQMMIKSLTLAPDGLRKDSEKLVLSQFGPSEALFDFFERGAQSGEVSTGMSFSVVLLDGIMRRVTVSRREPLKVIQLIAVDKHGLIIETEQTHESLKI
ncbi:recombinase family protein [Brucella sp. NM4]|uniref:recombinase family protein n=1 Tax=Brucella/Ochrobactrum group TaxID=2826938 RepID=UPI0024BCD884|nr:recombinase family protein [Brucella sp. NM4]WHS32065.1 recombinase family protein [Brucella sp. NM4]WHT41453.1 recombinase family protein [Ochrobactrum sp. SSR]